MRVVWILALFGIMMGTAIGFAALDVAESAVQEIEAVVLFIGIAGGSYITARVIEGIVKG